MALFRTLAQQLGFARDRTTEPKLGLSPEQIAALRSLRASDEWKAYTVILDTAITLYGEALLAARDDASLRELRGTILGLRKAVHIVDETIRQADELERSEQHKRSASDAARDGRLANLYGSPAFGRTVGK